MKNLNQKEWEEVLKTNPNAIIIDVRTMEECCGGILENAKNIDVSNFNDFLSQVQDLDKTKPYFIYCMAGGRSQMACQIMDELGFKNTYNLVGGISCWQGKIVENV